MTYEEIRIGQQVTWGDGSEVGKVDSIDMRRVMQSHPDMPIDDAVGVKVVPVPPASVLYSLRGNPLPPSFWWFAPSSLRPPTP